MYYVYVVHCADTSLYCGITTDLTRRVEEHNSRSSKSAAYTRRRSPVSLVYSEPCNSRAHALRLEYFFKTWNRKQKIAFLESGSTLSARYAKRHAEDAVKR